MSAAKQVIALVTDCDDTIAPDTTSRFLESRGVKPSEFWPGPVADMIRRGWDPSLAYLTKILALVGKDKPLGEVRLSDLRAFGASLGKIAYPGVSTLRKQLQAVAAEVSPNIDVEFYIVSGGMYDVVASMPLVKSNCAGVHACEFEEDPETGLIAQLKRVVTYTEKTRCLFEISKGITPAEAHTNPYAVNRYAPEGLRRIPFPNMIYLGDGLTDIPCFSLMQKSGGMAFAIFDPHSERSARRAVTEFIRCGRVASVHGPRYRRHDDLGALLRGAVYNIARRIAGGPQSDVRLTPAD